MSLSIKEFSDITPLGAEGFENVFLAMQTNNGRKVVIKNLLTFSSQPDPDIISRLENQSKSACGLHHENIITVHGFGLGRQSFFTAMDYIDGLDLGRLIHQHPFPMEIGLTILLNTIKGLQYAHAKGIVHYNLKPSNILVEKTGLVKVADFGFDHAKPGATKFNESSSDFMTLNYMPPEVANGQRDRTVSMDVWSTGVLAYHIVSGTLPFRGANFYKLVQSIIQDDVKDIRAVGPALPEYIAAEIMACLLKDPRSRPYSIDGLGASLETYFRDLGIVKSEEMIGNYLENIASPARGRFQRGPRSSEQKFNPDNRSFDTKQPPVITQAAIDDGNEPLIVDSPSGLLHQLSVFKSKKVWLSVGAVLFVAVLSTLIITVFSSKAGSVHQIKPPPPSMEFFQNDAVKEPQPATIPIPTVSDTKPLNTHTPVQQEKRPEAPARAPSVAAISAGKKKAPVLKSAQSRMRKPMTGTKQSSADSDFIESLASNFQTNHSSETPAATTSPEEKKKGIGTLHIHSYPWAEIYVDNTYQGTSPTPKPLSLSEGTHTITLKRDGFKTYTEAITIVKDDERRIKVQLEQ